MSRSADSNSLFTFGGRKVSAGKPTKPVPFTFSTAARSGSVVFERHETIFKFSPCELPARTNKQSSGPGRTPSTTGNLHHSKAPRPSPTPPSVSSQIKESSEKEVEPLYKLEDVKAAPGELEHLQKERDQSRDHEVQTTPLITREAYIAEKMSMQYGVLGEVLSIQSKSAIHKPIDPRLYINTNAPLSAVVCGIQGSGKSHTISALLENMFIPDLESIGKLSDPLAGLVLHFGEGGPNSRPCEAAWVGVPSDPNSDIETPLVRVYVSKSSFNTMKAVYEPLGEYVKVKPLVFNESELDAQALLSMMAVGTSDSAPLYIQTVLSILRELGESFSYQGFMHKLDESTFTPAQNAVLEQRLALLRSFIDTHPGQSSPRFRAGQLTILDLSDPFIDPSSACGLFEIVLRLFVRAEVGTGKVLVVDEAHKYLSTNRSVAGLTKSLLTLTREQRHLGMRVLISTQEPTVIPPVLLDLCTVAIMHRFSSPSWWEHLAQHISSDISTEEGFEKVVGLRTGEAVVLAPSGMGVFPNDGSGTDKRPSSPVATAQQTPLKVGQFGRRIILMKTRARVTKDGGASVLVA